MANRKRKRALHRSRAKPRARRQVGVGDVLLRLRDSQYRLGAGIVVDGQDFLPASAFQRGYMT